MKKQKCYVVRNAVEIPENFILYVALLEVIAIQCVFLEPSLKGTPIFL